MEKFIREYGVIILLYLVMVFGVIALNARMNYLNKLTETTELIQQKGFTK